MQQPETDAAALRCTGILGRGTVRTVGAWQVEVNVTRWIFLAGSLMFTACADGGAACDEQAFSCEGQLLIQCVDGAEVEVSNCDDEGGTCMAEMGHCHPDDDGMDGMDM